MFIARKDARQTKIRISPVGEMRFVLVFSKRKCVMQTVYESTLNAMKM